MEKTFCDGLSRPDSRVINKKTKYIIILEFKCTSDTLETYYCDMTSIVKRQHTVTYLRGSEHPGRGVGMGGGSFTSSLRTSFGQGKRVGRGHEDFWNKWRGWKKNHSHTGSLLLSEHEKLFGSYWRQVFGPPSSLMHLLGKGLYVRTSNFRKKTGL